MNKFPPPEPLVFEGNLSEQWDSVSFDQFVTDLKQRSSQCEFAGLKDSLIKDMIIIGVEDNQLRQKRLRTDDLTLDMAIKIGQAPETTKRHAMTLSRPEARNQTTVHALQTRQRESQLNSSSSHRLQIDANTAGVDTKEENALLMEKHVQNAVN